LLGEDPHNTQWHFNGMSFYENNRYFKWNHEDLAANTTHLSLIVLACLITTFWLFKKHRLAGRATLILTIAFLQFLLFAAYLKWQPWHTRLHTPMFMLLISLVVLSIEGNRFMRTVFQIVFPFMLLYAVSVVVFNASRPLWTTDFTYDVHVSDNRYRKYFPYSADQFNEFSSVSAHAYNQGRSNIGLIYGSNSQEYVLYRYRDDAPFRTFHLRVSNPTSIFEKNLILDAIISTSVDSAYVIQNGVKYINRTPNNTMVWFYQR
jgi:hypothetical protein